MTHTEVKLQDAGAQMKLALQNGGDEVVFRTCINAFLAAARSVTMIMEQESKGFPQLHAWYKDQTSAMSKDPLCTFFVDQRNLSIHRTVVQPQRESFIVKNSQRWRLQDPERGSIAAGRFTTPSDGPDAAVGDVIFAGHDHAFTWTFPDARNFMPDDSCNVIRLCEMHFIRLRVMVDEWLEKRRQFITENAG